MVDDIITMYRPNIEITYIQKADHNCGQPFYFSKTDMDINFAEIDRQKILAYLEQQGGEATVKDVLSHAGADTFRVYSLIQRMKFDGDIVITEENSLGTPTRVRREQRS